MIRNRLPGDGPNLLILIVVPMVVSVAVTLLVIRVWEGQRGGQQVIVVPTYSPTSLLPARSGDEPAPEPEDEREELDVVSDPTIPPGCENPAHQVQAGETLGAIATTYGVSIDDLIAMNQQIDPSFNPDFLSVGQTVIVPECGIPTPTPTPDPTATSQPTSPPPIPTATDEPGGAVDISIERVISPGEITEEAIEIINNGSPVNLSGWVLTNGDEEFEFPGFSLFTSGAVTVFTRDGTDDARSLFWGLDEALWAPGDTVELYDRDGNLQDSFEIPTE